MQTISRIRHAAALLAVAAVLAGCAQENPTEVGGTLLPGGISTYEVLIDPARFVLEDTSFSGYPATTGLAFLILARDFQGALDANIVSRLEIPRAIQVVDSLGNTQTDSTPTIFAGRVIMVLDSVALAVSDNASLRLFRLAEDYHPPSADWLLRVDTGNVDLPWTTPGGTAGGEISSTTWESGTDTIAFAVDSITMAEWADTLSPVRGFMIRATEGETRLRVADAYLELRARSRFKRDTTFTAIVRPPGTRYLTSAEQPAASADLVAGGSPSWRGFLRLIERLDTLALPCADGSPNCTLQLSEASVTAASLVFQPAAPIAGFAPEDSVYLSMREVLANASVPIQRSPLGSFTGTARPAAPGLFIGGAGLVEVPIGNYIRQFTDGDDVRPGPWLSLVQSPDGDTFGHAAFQGRPMLRLVISAGTELRPR